MPRHSSYYDNYWPTYEPSRPREADGIKAKSQRGEFTQSWWGKKWLTALTRLMDSGRLSRGRTYARKGQVLNIDLAVGKVAARVQGSRATPYKINISLKPLTDAQWDKVLDALAGQAIFSAQLLNGEMPADIEQVFESVKVPLFPSMRGDLTTECSCPDYANPCKHIAAVYHLLAERFDEDPFLLFELRGRDKARLLQALRARRAGGAAEAEFAVTSPHELEPVMLPPLADCLAAYWGARAAPEAIALRIAPPPVELALLKRAGLPDFVDAGFFRAQMERAYAALTARALEIAFADRE